ncbi:hypothetical protein H1R20_g2983, partial [Candolleomyces eurysporus]
MNVPSYHEVLSSVKVKIMQKLPSEIQLLIIDYLGALDILHLQLTCKYYHRVIEKSARNIWRNCLRQQCIENELFWPSFKDLSLASEFKDACTTSSRVVKFYETALERRDAVLRRTQITQLDFSEGLEDDDIQDIQEIFLVPGGRFLLTLQQFKWLCVWDLTLTRDDSQTYNLRLQPLLRHGIDAYENLVFIDAVIDSTKIRLLVKIRSGIPQEVASSINLGESSDQDVLGYQYLQLSMSGDTWSVQQLSHLTVIYPNGVSSLVKYNTLGDDKVIFHANSVTFVWDFVQNHVSMWCLEGVPQVYDVFSFGTHMFYLGLEGIFGLERPPFEPIECNCIIVPPASTSNTLTISPAFSILHQRRHENVDRVSGPDSCNSRILNYAPIIYEITETEQQNDDNSTIDVDIPQPRVTTIHRYRFRFNPTRPTESKLDLIESSTAHRRPLMLNPQPYSLSNGRLAAVWTEDYEDIQNEHWQTTSLFLSLSSKFDPTTHCDPHSVVDPTIELPIRTELGLVKFCDVEPSDDEDDETPPLNALACEFCPQTGRAIVLWESEYMSWVTLYDFLC